MKIITLTTLLVSALLLLVVLASPAQAVSPRSVAIAAFQELRAPVYENNGNNIPRYYGKRAAPYSVQGRPWQTAFVSYMFKGNSSLSRFSRRKGIKSRSGKKLVASKTLFTRWALKARRVSRRARPGYAVIYDNGQQIGIVGTVRFGKATSAISGDIFDSVNLVMLDPSARQHYIRP